MSDDRIYILKLTSDEVSIRELSRLIADAVGFEGTIEWDTSKPNGTPKRPLDFSKIRSMGWEPKYTLADGLAKTVQWYKENKT